MTKYTSIYNDKEIAKMTGAVFNYKKPVNEEIIIKLHEKEFKNRLLKIKCPMCKNPSVSACLRGRLM